MASAYLPRNLHPSIHNVIEAFIPVYTNLNRPYVGQHLEYIL